MEIITKFTDAQIVPNAQPMQQKDGSLVHYAKLVYFGGTASVRNPQKFSGRYAEVTVEAELSESSVIRKGFDSDQLEARSLKSVKFLNVLEVKPRELAKTSTGASK